MRGQVLIVVAVISVSLYLFGLMSSYDDDAEPKKKSKKRRYKRPAKRGGITEAWY